MYCVQNRIYCDVCNQCYIANIYPNQIKSQFHINNVLKDRCTNSMVVKTHFIKNK